MLKRRCPFHLIDHLMLQRAVEILDRASRVPGAAGAGGGGRPRPASLDLAKVPGVAETLDRPPALAGPDREELLRRSVDRTPGRGAPSTTKTCRPSATRRAPLLDKSAGLNGSPRARPPTCSTFPPPAPLGRPRRRPRPDLRRDDAPRRPRPRPARRRPPHAPATSSRPRGHRRVRPGFARCFLRRRRSSRPEPLGPSGRGRRRSESPRQADEVAADGDHGE